MRCYTGLEVEMIVRAMNSNKSKRFYRLRSSQRNILRAEIKNLEILSTVFDRAVTDSPTQVLTK